MSGLGRAFGLGFVDRTQVKSMAVTVFRTAAPTVTSFVADLSTVRKQLAWKGSSDSAGQLLSGMLTTASIAHSAGDTSRVKKVLEDARTTAMKVRPENKAEAARILTVAQNFIGGTQSAPDKFKAVEKMVRAKADAGNTPEALQREAESREDTELLRQGRTILAALNQVPGGRSVTAGVQSAEKGAKALAEGFPTGLKVGGAVAGTAFALYLISKLL